MNRQSAGKGRKSQERFCLHFQWRLRELLARRHSAAEGFGPAWEATLREVPLDDAAQADVYWQLIRWAGREELFTSQKEHELLHAWRDAVHEF